MRRRAFLPALVAAALAFPAAAQVSATGTEYVTFWRGDLRILATRGSTEVTLIDINTGLPLATSAYTSSHAGNPFVLRDAGDLFEGSSLGQTLRVRIVAARANGPREDKPVIVWTGAIDAALKHPAAPPVASNAWMSYFPALAPGSVENGAEIGRDLWGFASRELYVFARQGATPTAIDIVDLTNAPDPDSDDSRRLTPASPELLADDGTVEIYHVDGFEDDALHVTANTDVAVLAGIGASVANDWTATPPSFGAGEDFRELGTLFYAFVHRDLTVFPTQDRTTVTITDLSDGDDTTTFTLKDGDFAGDYSLFTADLAARNGTGVTPRAAAPAVTVRTLGSYAPFDNDIVRIESDRPVLVYIGPKASDVGEYADVAYSVRTGPTSFLVYGYAQNGGAEDFQLFAFDAATAVGITSLTYTTGFGAARHHDFTLPAPTPWQGGNAVTGDRYWSSGIWSGELLRITADGPVAIMDGDYDAPNFGCFLPFVASSGLLKPIADAGPDTGSCPGSLTVRLDGSASFDADTTPGVLVPEHSWDVDAAVDADGDGDSTNDADRAGAVVSHTYAAPGVYTVTLTYRDDDGQSDTDDVVVRAGIDAIPPFLDCPVRVEAPSGPAGTAFVAVLATASDDCTAAPAVANDRTAGGADASDDYPCGTTLVTFTATDDDGNAAACVSEVVVTPVVPGRVTEPLHAVKVLPADILWSTAPPATDPSPWLRLYASDAKPVPAASRRQVAEIPALAPACVEPGGIALPPAVGYYQLVRASCDRLTEGPY